MEVIIAKTLGFCGGVKATINNLKEKLNSSTIPVYCLNYPVHNSEVIAELESLGLRLIKNLAQIQKPAVLAISAHGVPPEILVEAKNSGLEIFDTTCPKVSFVQQTAHNLYQEAYRMFILGDVKHVEVIGIAGYCDYKLEAVLTLQDLPAFDPLEKVALIAQTTQSLATFTSMVGYLQAHLKNFIAVNTICSATIRRQEAALEVAKLVDLMIVIGDQKSSNSKQLASLCQEQTKTLLIQNAKELPKDLLNNVHKVGISAGASTPDQTITELFEILKRF